MGSLSQFDSLSYALGANIGFGMGYEYRDIPFDYDRFYQDGDFGTNLRIPTVSISVDGFSAEDVKLFMRKRLLLIIAFNRSSNRYLRMSSIVIGLVIGYIAAWFMARGYT